MIKKHILVSIKDVLRFDTQTYLTVNKSTGSPLVKPVYLDVHYVSQRVTNSPGLILIVGACHSVLQFYSYSIFLHSSLIGHYCNPASGNLTINFGLNFGLAVY